MVRMSYILLNNVIDARLGHWDQSSQGHSINLPKLGSFGAFFVGNFTF